MEFLKLAQDRFSVRSYSDKPVEKEKIEKILKAGFAAPTAVNNQPQKIYVITNPDMLAKLNELRPLFGAPAAVLICYDETLSWKNQRDSGHDGGEVDAAIVTTHMMLQAWELGVGSCWMAAYSPKAVSELFDLPGHIHPVAILTIGYASEDCQPSARHSVCRSEEEVVSYIE